MRLAVVTPRYGPEVAGGAERLAREYATRLSHLADVTVLTTCARDYVTWADDFTPGTSNDDAVTVHRFSVPIPRDIAAFDALTRVALESGSRDVQETWLDAQGPNAPDLLEHLVTQGRSYDAVLFVPYLYSTTGRGLPLVKDRAILIPALHDEPWLQFAIFDDLVAAPRLMVFSTPEEQQLAMERFPLDPSRCAVIGAGIDPVPSDLLSPASVGLGRPYVVAVGRIDPSKGSDELIRDHSYLVERTLHPPDLVLLGPSAMDLPRKPWLHCPGFVSEETKNATIANAIALVCPSPYESLSLVLLEAWAHGTPTIATAKSPVLVGQSARSGGGLWYRDEREYMECVDLLTRAPALNKGLGIAGRRYTRTLSWDRVIGRLFSAIESVANSQDRLDRK